MKRSLKLAAWSLILNAPCVVQPCLAADESSPIVDVRFDAPYRQIDSSYGDEWAPTWGRNDVLYTGNDDGSSFGKISPNLIAFGKLEGNDPYRLEGTTVNRMDDFAEPKRPGPEGAMWKALGSYEADGVFYRLASCSSTSGQEAACLMRSTDGKTWVEVAPRPIFQNAHFATPAFITYRGDVAVIQAAMQKDFNDYIYAASYAGVVDGEDKYLVGRVLRPKLGQASPADWTFQSPSGWQRDSRASLLQSNHLTLFGPDQANWKTTNSYSVDGVLYMFVTRCHYPWLSGDPKRRHIFQNSSIIKSTDDGRTWSRSAQANLKTPMFSGKRFGTPYFVWYGKDGAAQRDNADRYVYAISNNGHFEGGDDYVLGRVLRSKLADLSPSDWSFYRSGDGMVDGNWTPSLEDAVSVLSDPGRSSMTGMTYIEALRRYVMVVWHYTHVSFATAIEHKDLSTVLEFYEAPKPWGPWTSVQSIDTGRLGWYAPIIGQRFQTQADKGAVKAFLYVTGFFTKPEGGLDFELFKMNYIPITLSTRPLQHKVPGYAGGR